MISKFNVKHINDNVAIRYDLNCWALPIQIIHWWNPMYNCKDTQIQVLCFSIRFLHRREKNGEE